MADRLPHLHIARSEPVNDRRRGSGFGPSRPVDPEARARDLRLNLDVHTDPPQDERHGFDPRLLLKLHVDGISAEELTKLPDFSVVSEEKDNVVVLFSTSDGLAEFRRRLAILETGERATRDNIIFAVRQFDYISAEDRKGLLLVQKGIPSTHTFFLDVELWPLELSHERDQIHENFKVFCAEKNIEITDFLKIPALVIFRVETTEDGLNEMLNMRDVRRVELPPQEQFDSDLLETSVDDLPSIEIPTENAPTIAVLDSGIVSAHPLLKDFVGDAQSFVDDNDPSDSVGHGTSVAGIALHGDVEQVLSSDSTKANIRLLSGKISTGSADSKLIENRIIDAVKYFHGSYSCRIYVLALGIQDLPYKGGHVGSLAATIDWLSREYNVLFVVPTGNFSDPSQVKSPTNWLESYPDYLLNDNFSMLDPAPAVNALTVGSVAQYELPRLTTYRAGDPAIRPIARKKQPSSFTLSGPGPNKAIKPDFVHFGGNRYVDPRDNTRPSPSNDLGVLSLNRDFASGNLFRLVNGTSFAAPRVANLAANLLNIYPNASASLIRTLIAAHSEIPNESASALDLHKSDVLKLVGYGMPNDDFSMYSEENRVTILSEASLQPNHHHFYEFPLPDDLFISPARRPRKFTVALAHTPRVRRTRLQYRESSFSFRIVKAENLNEVTQAYRRLSQDEVEPSISESGFFPGPNLRDGGTLQCANRVMEQVDVRLRSKPYYLVVTRKVPDWVTSEESEDYSVVIVIQDLSEEPVKLYSQIQVELKNRASVRVTV